MDDDIALFDMDGSLADYTTALVNDLELLRSPEEDKITEENIWEADKLPHIQFRMRLIKRQPGWWLKLRPLPAGLEVWDLCKRFGFKNTILTKGPKKHSNAWDEKLQWCQKFLDPEVDVHIVSDKSGQYGKLLYDDYPEYMLKWLKHRPRGLGIMPVTPVSKGFSHPQVIMYRGVEDMEKLIRVIKQVKERKPGQALEL